MAQGSEAMRRKHKKKRKASVLCVKRSEARDCISDKSGQVARPKMRPGGLDDFFARGGDQRHDRGHRRRIAPVVSVDVA